MKEDGYGSGSRALEVNIEDYEEIFPIDNIHYIGNLKIVYYFPNVLMKVSYVTTEKISKFVRILVLFYIIITIVITIMKGNSRKF